MNGRSARWLGGSLAVLALLLAAVAGHAQVPAEACSVMMDEPPANSAYLAVTVQVAAIGGAPPAPGLPTSSPPTSSAPAGTLVQVLDPNAPATVLAEQPTDAQGQAWFCLPPGQYLVQASPGDRSTGLRGTQEAVTLVAGSTTSVTLTMRRLLP